MFWDKKEINDSLKEIHNKMEKHSKENDIRLDRIEKVLIVQEQNLKDHMRRSEHLEQIVELEKKNLQSELEPVKKHINMVTGGVKLLIFLLAFGGAIVGIIKTVI